jgi:hypothetical protein
MPRCSKQKSSRWPLLAIPIVLGLIALAALEPQLERGAIDDRLWQAIVKVESGGNPWAYAPEEDAGGIVQIRPECLEDCNRIARISGLPEHFTLEDRFDPTKSRRMWQLYLWYWGWEYERTTGWPATNEVYARLWNGGPTGWHKEATVAYWDRVRRAMPAPSVVVLDMGSEPPPEEAP